MGKNDNEEAKGLIYMRTSPSGKSYIGLTVLSEKTRWKQHIRDAYNPTNTCYNSKLSIAIRKYPEQFTVIILEDNIPRSVLGEKEKYYIQKYNTYENGYNSTLGGEGCLPKYDSNVFIQYWKQGYTLSEIAEFVECAICTVRKHLETQLSLTEEDFRNRTFKRRRKYNEQEDIVVSEMYKNGFSINQIADYFQHSATATLNSLKRTETIRRPAEGLPSRPICQINLETREVINVFSSAREAGRVMNIDKAALTRVASHQGNHRTSCGYGWEWLDAIEEDKNE